MLVSVGEADPIRSAIVRNEAWTQDPVKRLRADADRALREGPWTVTSDRPVGRDLDSHIYYSEPVFPQSGASRLGRGTAPADAPTARFDANRTALREMSDAVFSLGTAAFLLDDRRYAQRAAVVIDTWFLNPKTRMEPTFGHAQSGTGPNAIAADAGVLDARPLIRAIQGMSFLAESGDWDVKEQAAIHKWFGDYMKWLAQAGSSEAGGRGAAAASAWWAAEMAAAAAFNEDAVAQRAAVEFYRAHAIPREIGTRPAAPQGAGRGAAVPGGSALDGLATFCRIAAVRGADLWNTHAADGASLSAVADAFEAGLAASGNQGAQRGATPRTSGLDFLAFAGMGLNKPDCIAQFRRLERPGTAWLALVDLLVGRWEASAHQTRH